MRKINISNNNRRNSIVGFELPKGAPKIVSFAPDGTAVKSVRILRSTSAKADLALTKQYGDDLTDAIIESNVEIDPELVGKYLRGVKRVYIDLDGKVAYKVARQTVFFNPDGTMKSAQPFHQTQANINSTFPLRWTGKMIPRQKAIRMFVFSRKYQIRHVDSLTFDFLYDMARQLHESDSMMLVGAGEKGVNPLAMSTGGVPYRAFLEGRIDGDKYCLLLHLTNLELKCLTNNE